MVIDMHHTRIWVARYSCIAQDSVEGDFAFVNLENIGKNLCGQISYYIFISTTSWGAESSAKLLDWISCQVLDMIIIQDCFSLCHGMANRRLSLLLQLLSFTICRAVDTCTGRTTINNGKCLFLNSWEFLFY